MNKKIDFEKKWRETFKKAGFGPLKSKPVEVDGIVYESLTDASVALGKPVSWIKKNGKIIK